MAYSRSARVTLKEVRPVAVLTFSPTAEPNNHIGFASVRTVPAHCGHLVTSVCRRDEAA